MKLLKCVSAVFILVSLKCIESNSPPQQNDRVAKPVIVAGTTVTDRKTRPYLVRLENPLTHRAFCTGTLISLTHVLTAGHCIFLFLTLERFKGLSFEVVVGDLSSNITNEVGEQRFPISPSYGMIHPLYNHTGNHAPWDLGLLPLPRPVQETDYAKPIRVYTLLEGNNLAGKTIIASGWGGNSITSNGTSVTLQTAEMDGADCTPHKYGPETLCLGGGNEQSVICGGDSGSPIVMYINGEPMLVGVHTAGYCNPDFIEGFDSLGLSTSYGPYSEYICPQANCTTIPDGNNLLEKYEFFRNFVLHVLMQLGMHA